MYGMMELAVHTRHAVRAARALQSGPVVYAARHGQAATVVMAMLQEAYVAWKLANAQHLALRALAEESAQRSSMHKVALGAQHVKLCSGAQQCMKVDLT